MKLYEAKKGQHFRIVADSKVPPGAATPESDLVLRLRDIDGMYSYCTDNKGRVYHPVAWSEIEIVEDLV